MTETDESFRDHPMKPGSSFTYRNLAVQWSMTKIGRKQYPETLHLSFNLGAPALWLGLRLERADIEALHGHLDRTLKDMKAGDKAKARLAHKE
jgi:hypothetical protein